MPSSPCDEMGTNSGARLADTDPDATATVPGIVTDAVVSDEVAGGSKVFDCTQAPSDTGDLVKNASQYSERCAPEAGFRRCTSRLGVPSMRAPWFESDAPQYIASSEWQLYTAISCLRLPKAQQV